MIGPQGGGRQSDRNAQSRLEVGGMGEVAQREGDSRTAAFGIDGAQVVGAANIPNLIDLWEFSQIVECSRDLCKGGMCTSRLSCRAGEYRGVRSKLVTSFGDGVERGIDCRCCYLSRPPFSAFCADFHEKFVLHSLHHLLQAFHTHHSLREVPSLLTQLPPTM